MECVTSASNSTARSSIYQRMASRITDQAMLDEIKELIEQAKVQKAVTRSSKAASVGGLCYPSLATAFLARRRIDFADRSHWLHHRGISSAVACWTFLFDRIRG
jgi:hypothetical protein